MISSTGFNRFIHWALLAGLLAACGLAQAQRAGKADRLFGNVEALDYDVRPTGIRPTFPGSVQCPGVDSAYGSQERFDGSVRRDDRNGGLHGGLDISLAEGTELLAPAAGTVIALGEGGRLEGIYLWLQHSPDDSGLGYWIYTKYQHLSKLPVLKAGTRVAAGQPIALSGMTGTIGPAFGPKGYAHLHVSIFVGNSPEYSKTGELGTRIRSPGALLADPMLFYIGPFEFAAIDALPEARKRPMVAVVLADGRRLPADAKTVWPVRCETKGRN